VDESKKRIQGAIDGLRLVLTNLKDCSSESMYETVLADLGSDSLQITSPAEGSVFAPSEKASGNKGQGLSFSRSILFFEDSKSPKVNRETASVVRSLGDDMREAARGHEGSALRKWRADAEKSARLGEELQALVVEQDRQISQLQAQSAQERAVWQQERARLAADRQAAVEAAVESARRECGEELELERAKAREKLAGERGEWTRERRELLDAQRMACDAARQQAVDAESAARIDLEKEVEVGALVSSVSCFFGAPCPPTHPFAHPSPLAPHPVPLRRFATAKSLLSSARSISGQTRDQSFGSWLPTVMAPSAKCRATSSASNSLVLVRALHPPFQLPCAPAVPPNAPRLSFPSNPCSRA